MNAKYSGYHLLLSQQLMPVLDAADSSWCFSFLMPTDDSDSKLKKTELVPKRFAHTKSAFADVSFQNQSIHADKSINIAYVTNLIEI